MKEYTVKEVSELLEKHEETIKRWIDQVNFQTLTEIVIKKVGELLNRIYYNLIMLYPSSKLEHQEDKLKSEVAESELIILAYQAVTLSSRLYQILSILSVVGIKRTLEILLIMQQSPTKVKNPDGFIRKAVRENWNPTSIPIKLPNKPSKRLYELTEQNLNSIIISHKIIIRRLNLYLFIIGLKTDLD